MNLKQPSKYFTTQAMETKFFLNVPQVRYLFKIFELHCEFLVVRICPHRLVRLQLSDKCPAGMGHSTAVTFSSSRIARRLKGTEKNDLWITLGVLGTFRGFLGWSTLIYHGWTGSEIFRPNRVSENFGLNLPVS